MKIDAQSYRRQQLPEVLITCYVLYVTYLLVSDNILWTSIFMLLLVFTYHVMRPKNRNYSINKVTNKGHNR